MNRAEVDAHRSEVSERLARLEEKHDSLYEIAREVKVLLQLQNGRVRGLENKQSWLMGGLGAITFVFGVLIAWIKGSS